MAVSRGMLLLCLGTLMVSVVLIKVAEAHDQDHHSGPCHGDQNKGDQCREDEEDVIGDDDVDDTYKIVNKVAVSFTGRLGDFDEASSTPQEPDEAEPEDAEDQSHLIVLGH